jgi:hypothetical protein
MDRSVAYPRHAQDCLALVELVSSEEAKSSLFGMAQCFHRLAQEAEAGERAEVARKPEPGPEGDPQSPP